MVARWVGNDSAHPKAEKVNKEDASDLGDMRLLCCSPASIDTVGMIISDINTLLTVSDWMEESALLTQDQNLIRVARNCYNSPSCCTGVRGGGKREKKD